MKSGKIKRIYLALITVISAVLFFGIFAVNGVVYAEEVADNVSGFNYCNFVYSAQFPAEAGADRTGFVFGADDNSGWIAAAETAENRVALYRHDEDEVELKSIGYDFSAGEELKMTLVVNEGVAKIFIGSDDVAVLTCKLDGYEGGKATVIGDASNISLMETDTPDGNIYVGGFSVLKVVNLTDGNYILNSNEYSLTGGVLTVTDSYIKTLEAKTEYSFRAVTAFTDFNFTVNTTFTSVSATPSIEKYYKNNDVTLELSGNVKVHRLLIDGKECNFTQTEDRVVISSDLISSLATGKHSVKLFTDKGRPETSFNLSERVETVTEPVVKSAHVWLWIDLSIFAAAIIGYITYSILKKKKKN